VFENELQGGENKTFDTTCSAPEPVKTFIAGERANVIRPRGGGGSWRREGSGISRKGKIANGSSLQSKGFFRKGFG